MDLKELESGVDANTHWYYQSKKIPMLAFVKRIYAEKKIKLNLIDVGSGSGFFMYEAVKEIPECVASVMLVDIGYTDEEISAFSHPVIRKSKSLPEQIENAVVVMMDVLEHLPDDAAMLNEIKKRSIGENYFFITVPAFMQLWSGHDVYLGHYRRYTNKTLKKLLQESAFSIQHLYYIYGMIFPMVWIARRMKKNSQHAESDMKPSSPFINSTLKMICSAEMSIAKLNKVAGVSCVAEGKI